MKTAVQVTIYMNESDKWDRILRMLQAEGIRGASVYHAVAGFNGRHAIHRSSLVNGGGQSSAVLGDARRVCRPAVQWSEEGGTDRVRTKRSMVARW